MVFLSYLVGCLVSKRWFLLLVLSFLALLGVFFRPFLLGVDAYASWSCVVYGWCDSLGWQQGFVWFLELMPPVLFLAKLVMLCSLFLCVVAWFKILNLYFEERVCWISVFFGFGLVPVIVFEFSKFENELLAFPLFFWGLYFLLKKFSVKNLFFGFGLWFVSLFFWLWLGIFFNSSWITFFLNGSVSSIVELQFFSGFFSLFFGLLVLPLVFFVKNKKLWFFFVVFLLGLFLSGKLVVFLVPFCMIGIAKIVELLDEKKYNYDFLWVLVIIMFFGLQLAVFVQQPSGYELVLVEDSVKMSVDENLSLKNDWSFGYWLWFYGYKTKNHPGNGVDSNFLEKPNISLTSKDLSSLGCVRTGNEFSTATRKMILWKCV